LCIVFITGTHVSSRWEKKLDPHTTQRGSMIVELRMNNILFCVGLLKERERERERERE
jgi:hypothetical protein